MHITVYEPQSFFHGVLRFWLLLGYKTHGKFRPADLCFNQIRAQQKVKKSTSCSLRLRADSAKEVSTKPISMIRAAAFFGSTLQRCPGAIRTLSNKLVLCQLLQICFIVEWLFSRSLWQLGALL